MSQSFSQRIQARVIAQYEYATDAIVQEELEKQKPEDFHYNECIDSIRQKTKDLVKACDPHNICTPQEIHKTVNTLLQDTVAIQLSYQIVLQKIETDIKHKDIARDLVNPPRIRKIKLVSLSLGLTKFIEEKLNTPNLSSKTAVFDESFGQNTLINDIFDFVEKWRDRANNVHIPFAELKQAIEDAISKSKEIEDQQNIPNNLSELIIYRLEQTQLLKLDQNMR